MKVLVIGGGGREHALAWKLAASKRVQRVYVAPGNGGTTLDERFESVAITEVAALRAWAQENRIALTVVGPEGPLANGVVDEFRAHGLRIFGPTRAAAQLESSKAFAKDFMRRHGIPTAEYQVFTDAAAAHAYVGGKGAPIVVKADGLAAGKGVVVAMTLDEAHAAVDAMLPAGQPSAANDVDAAPRVVIEECLHGEEASFIVLCDGKNVLALATSQDHKRLEDGDRGPNTGGMGAYSPAPVVTAEVHARAMREVILPTLHGMEQDGIRYTGFLYAGLMIGPDGRPRTLEFNCRLGDPEAQPILMRLKSDLFEVLWAATEPGLHGQLDRVDLQWDRRTALGVVLAAHGYPLSPRRGDAITGLPKEADDAVVFHAGTTLEGGVLRTAGGRVLCVTVLADKLPLAQARCYELVRAISFDGMQYRRDIGHRANV
ncbi:MAG: Phosphoribosylamine--glycine ligase [Burkholderiaceae bacterium]|jgi:phosphoribosylamine--glycine ligase|nr:MAG: Phosphoribosylamine--glycine ligase [Burkholderiaceae bacterium]